MDITYQDQGLFTAFYAESKAGTALMDQFMEQNEGSNKVLSVHAKSVIARLRKLGYSVKKAKPVTQSDAELLSALGL